MPKSNSQKLSLRTNKYAKQSGWLETSSAIPSGSSLAFLSGLSTIHTRPTISTASLMVNRCFAMLFGRLASLA